MMADAVSKSDYSRFEARAKNTGLRMNPEPGTVAYPLFIWVQDPIKDKYLVDKICKYLATRTEMLGYSC